jgi:hypothetical protein
MNQNMNGGPLGAITALAQKFSHGTGASNNLCAVRVLLGKGPTLDSYLQLITGLWPKARLFARRKELPDLWPGLCCKIPKNEPNCNCPQPSPLCRKFQSPFSTKLIDNPLR